MNNISFKKTAKEGDIILTAKGKLFYILLKDDDAFWIAYSRWNNSLWNVYKDLSCITLVRNGIWQFIGRSWEPNE